MKNEKNFLNKGLQPLASRTRGQAPFLLLILIFLFSSNFSGRAYWHQVYVHEEWTTIFYNIVGDSSALYAGFYKNSHEVQCGVIKSTNLGKTWNKIYDEPKISNLSSSPFKYYVGLEYPASGYMYFLYSSRSEPYGTGIKRFNEQTEKMVDSIVISERGGFGSLHNFSMYDSLNGIYFWGTSPSLTRDGWKSRKQYGFNDSTTANNYDTNFTYAATSDIKMIDKNTIFFYGSDINELLKDDNYDSKKLIYGYHKMIIGEGDSTCTFEALGNGINLEISKDSIINLKTGSALQHQKGPRSFAYINDSTWLYCSDGKKTGYYDDRTLEIFKTTNKGESYRQVCMMDIHGKGLSRIDFKDELHGLAVGNGAILRTSDGGETWTADLEETHFFKKDWTKENYPHWNINISYADGMSFLGMYNVGVYKFEDSIGTVGVKERTLNCSLIYPNPIQAGKILNFKIPQLISGRAFIYDIYGNKVDELNFFGNSIQLRNDIVAGTYFLVIGDVNEKIIMRSKFIVR